ncbi:hypothetical protein HHI36_014677 [Cryptolaemus montrouzieri]|uniref:CCHC-type domain-containing protein n=1 Tax=Cryptolaemus montrouzieri TaxID=559131 RepID=A0ABD2N3E1_9CUCU
MEIRKPIPSHITISNKQYWITHLGQTRTCVRCGETNHEIKNCNKSLNIRLRRPNFATITEGTGIQGIRKPTNLPIGEIQNEQENHFQVLRSNTNKREQSDEKKLNEKQPTDAAMEQMNQEPKEISENKDDELQIDDPEFHRKKFQNMGRRIGGNRERPHLLSHVNV